MMADNPLQSLHAYSRFVTETLSFVQPNLPFIIAEIEAQVDE